MNNDSPLVSTQWLSNNLDNPNLRIIDVRWGPTIEDGKGGGFDDYEGYLEAHIPGAVFLPIVTELVDQNNPIPDMLVHAEQFEKIIGRLGIDNETLVVVYDNMGVPVGSARFWWALSYFGHNRVKVLDGGLKQWQLEKHPVSKEIPEISQTTYTANPRRSWIAQREEVNAAISDGETLIIDCLPEEQYSGHDNPWGTRAGHIPGAVNIPAISNLDPALSSATLAERAKLLEQRGSFIFSDVATITELYKGVGLRPEREIITYCGRGYAASCGMLALKAIGHGNVRLYDGSWADWSSDPELPVETS
ncbi:MAG: sulfurtransferase [Rhizobiaceae bacterium]